MRNKHKQYITKHHRSKAASEIARTLNISEVKVKEYIAQNYSRRPLSRKKKAVFSFIMISVPVLFFVLLELVLRMGNYGGNLDLFYYPERFNGEYVMMNHHYHDKFFFQTTTFEAGRGDVFLKEKPENGFRIFVLGASTTESFPYGYNGVFSLVIRDMLEDVLPDRHVEVVNLGITATNTYTLYDQAGEILKYEPDAIMIYSGQNEYYGALGIASSENIGSYPGLVRMYMKLYRYRTFLLFRDMFGWISSRITGFDKYQEEGTLMQRLVQQHIILLDSRIYEAGIRQFSDNLDAILEMYSKNNIPVFLSSLASNLKDHPPFYSVETDDHPPAGEIYDRARTEYLDERYDAALEFFRLARDLDALRFRAPSSFNEIIREKAEMHGARYIPLKELFLEHSENGIIGSGLMLEHLHPNSNGYFLMGKLFFEQLVEAELPGLQVDLNRLKEPEQYREAMHLTELDHRMVWHRVEALMNSWPFVEEPDPEGYPANYEPVSEPDRLAINHVLEHINWEEAKTTMARWYSQNGMHDEAIREIMGALRVVPYEEEAWRFAGWLALQGEKPDEAFDFYRTAYEIRPTNITCRNLGIILIDRQNYEEGAAWLEEAYRLDRSDHNSLFNASVAHASAENFQKALELADQLERINPNYSDLQMWRIHLLSRIESEPMN